MLKYTGTIVTSSFEEGDRSERSRQAPPNGVSYRHCRMLSARLSLKTSLFVHGTTAAMAATLWCNDITEAALFLRTNFN